MKLPWGTPGTGAAPRPRMPADDEARSRVDFRLLQRGSVARDYLAQHLAHERGDVIEALTRFDALRSTLAQQADDALRGGEVAGAKQHHHALTGVSNTVILL